MSHCSSTTILIATGASGPDPQVPLRPPKRRSIWLLLMKSKDTPYLGPTIDWSILKAYDLLSAHLASCPGLQCRSLLNRRRQDLVPTEKTPRGAGSLAAVVPQGDHGKMGQAGAGKTISKGRRRWGSISTRLLNRSREIRCGLHQHRLLSLRGLLAPNLERREVQQSRGSSRNGPHQRFQPSWHDESGRKGVGNVEFSCGNQLQSEVVRPDSQQEAT